jgi:hypothetical protein
LDIIAFADGETNVELSIDRFADQDGLGVAGTKRTRRLKDILASLVPMLAIFDIGEEGQES